LSIKYFFVFNWKQEKMAQQIETLLSTATPFIRGLDIEEAHASKLIENLEAFLEGSELYKFLQTLLRWTSIELNIETHPENTYVYSFNEILLKDFLNERVNILDTEFPEKWFMRNTLLYIIRFNTYCHIPPHLIHIDYSDDIEIMQEIVSRRLRNGHYCNMRSYLPSNRHHLLRSHEFVLKMVEANPEFIFNYDSSKWLSRHKEIAYKAIEMDPTIYQRLQNKAMWDYDIMLYAVKTDSSNHRFIPYEFWETNNHLSSHMKEVIIASIINDNNHLENRFERSEDGEYLYPYLYDDVHDRTSQFPQNNPDYYNDPDIIRAIEARQVPEELQILQTLLQLNTRIQDDIEGWLSIRQPLTISTLGGDTYELNQWLISVNIQNLMVEQLPELINCDIHFEDTLVSQTNIDTLKRSIIRYFSEHNELPIGLIVFPEE
jgi:hypothetical protein